MGGFKHGGLTEFDRRVSENVAAIANLTKLQNRLSSSVGGGGSGGGANGANSKYLDSSDLESVLEDGDMASASRAVTDRDLERLRCEQERLLQERLKRRDVCMSQIWTVVLTAFLDSMERISRWEDESTEIPSAAPEQQHEAGTSHASSASDAESGASTSSSPPRPRLRPLTLQGQAICHRIAKHGFLIMFESLLSCWSKEKGMLEDLLGSTRLLKRCAIEVFRMEHEPPEQQRVAEPVPSPQPAPVPAPQRRPSGPPPMPPLRRNLSARSDGGDGGGHEVVQLSESSDAADDAYDSTDDSDFDGSSDSESAEFVDTLGASVAAKRAAEAAAAALNREDSQRAPETSLSFEYLRNSLSFYRVPVRLPADSGKQHGHEESNGEEEEGLEQTLWDNGTLVARVGLPSTIYDRLPTSFRSARIRVRPVLFSQGINEQHNMANVVGVYRNCLPTGWRRCLSGSQSVRAQCRATNSSATTRLLHRRPTIFYVARCGDAFLFFFFLFSFFSLLCCWLLCSRSINRQCVPAKGSEPRGPFRSDSILQGSHPQLPRARQHGPSSGHQVPPPFA